MRYELVLFVLCTQVRSYYCATVAGLISFRIAWVLLCWTAGWPPNSACVPLRNVGWCWSGHRNGFFCSEENRIAFAVCSKLRRHSQHNYFTLHDAPPTVRSSRRQHHQQSRSAPINIKLYRRSKREKEVVVVVVVVAVRIQDYENAFS